MDYVDPRLDVLFLMFLFMGICQLYISYRLFKGERRMRKNQVFLGNQVVRYIIGPNGLEALREKDYEQLRGKPKGKEA